MIGLKYGLAAASAALMLVACGDHSTETAEGAQPANAGAPAPQAVSQTPLTKAASDPALQWGPCPEGMPEGCGVAVLHGDPAQPNADIFLRVPGGSSIPAHSHSSAERMILVSGELEVKYQGAPATTLRSGHYAYGPAKLPHMAQCRSSEPCTLFIAFEAPVDVLPFQGQIR